MPIRQKVLHLDVPDVDYIRDYTPEERTAAWAAADRLLVELTNTVHNLTTCTQNIAEIDRARKMAKQIDALRIEVMKIRFPQHWKENQSR